MTTPNQWVKKLGNRIERQRLANQPALLKELIEQVQRESSAELAKAKTETDALRTNVKRLQSENRALCKQVSSLETQLERARDRSVPYE